MFIPLIPCFVVIILPPKIKLSIIFNFVPVALFNGKSKNSAFLIRKLRFFLFIFL